MAYKTYRDELRDLLCDLRRCADEDLVDVAGRIADLIIEIATGPEGVEVRP